MATTELTAQNFEQTVLDNETVFVDFWADWCGPCQRSRRSTRTSRPSDGIVFAKVDTEAEQALAAAVNITSIPTRWRSGTASSCSARPVRSPRTPPVARPAGRGARHGRRPRRAGRQEGRASSQQASDPHTATETRRARPRRSGPSAVPANSVTWCRMVEVAELNPRPMTNDQDFSGRSALWIFSAPELARTRSPTGPAE